MAATQLWSAHPECPEHVKADLEARVRSFPPSYLLAPIAGEVFDNLELCKERLQGWALSQGFAIVRTSGSVKRARQRFEFRCIHHGDKTANTRQLEDHVERDEENTITTRRKQEFTNSNARSCLYLVVLSRKQLGRRGSGVFGLVLGVPHDTHSHSMAVNPLRYKREHVQALPSFLPALELGKSLRSANITYSVALRVLEQVGFPLDRNTYYNIRDRTASADRNEFAGLVVALEEAGFIFECRMEEEFDPETNAVIDRQLQQLWFAHPKQIRYAQRFIADWALFIDGTFRTNALNLVLIVTAGITNCGSTFVSSLSFARSESKLSFDFIFDSLKKHIFYDPYPAPRVIVSDQAAGIKASMPIALPNSILQFCDWHAVKNVEKRLLDKGYSKELRIELKALLWDFVKSKTHTILKATRTALHLKLRPDEIRYLQEYWGPKEPQFVRVYTCQYPNLGAHSNQRSESLHPGTTDILNKQLSLEAASRRLSKTVQARLRELSVQESQSAGKLPRTLDQRAFLLLADTISFYAINKISPEWEIIKDEINRATHQFKAACSSCELLVRYGLPCKHYLAGPCQDGAPIPRSMIHPRWWLNGEPIQITRWAPIYHTFTLPISPPRPPQATQNPYLSPHRNEITTLGLQVLEARDNLTGYARIRYDTAATNAQQGLVQYAQELQEDDLYTRMPDIVKKSGWNRQFKSHDKTQKRLMIGVEAAERDANYREQAAAREARLQSRDGYLLPEPTPSCLPPTEVERVPDTPPRRAVVAASLLLSSQIRTMMPQPQMAFMPATPILFSQIRTPTPPRRAPAAAALIVSSQLRPDIEEEEEEKEEKEEEAAAETKEECREEEEEEEEEEEAFILPPSTAPAILSRAGRKRAPTMKALEAEKASKRGTGQGRAGRGRGRGSRGGRQGQRQ